MRKWLGVIFTMASLLLLVGTVGVWVASQWVRTWVGSDLRAGAGERPAVWQAEAAACRGSLAVALHFHRLYLPTPDRAARFREDWSRAAWFNLVVQAPAQLEIRGLAWRPDETSWQWGGFGWAGDAFPERGGLRPAFAIARSYYSFDASRTTAVALPWWFLALCFALAPARTAYKWNRGRHHRRGAHHCPACGYDCRATPDGAGAVLPACPECGRPTAAAAGAAAW